MALLSISEAARLCQVSRTTLQRAIRTGRLALTPDHQLDTAELLRAGYRLGAAPQHVAGPQAMGTVQQDDAVPSSRAQQAPALAIENQYYARNVTFSSRSGTAWCSRLSCCLPCIRRRRST